MTTLTTKMIYTNTTEETMLAQTFASPAIVIGRVEDVTLESTPETQAPPTQRIKERERGIFGLPEQLTALVISFIVASVVIAGIAVGLVIAKTGGCIQQIGNIGLAADLYDYVENTYPGGGSQIDVTAAAFVPADGTPNQYMTQTPSDPAAARAAMYTFQDTSSAANTDDYMIICPGTHAAYTLVFLHGWSTSAKTITLGKLAGMAVQ